MKISFSTLLFAAVFIVSSCKDEKAKPTVPAAEKEEPVVNRVAIKYQVVAKKDSIKKVTAQYDSVQMNILYAVNRVDKANFKSLDSIILPTDVKQDIWQYFPFPARLSGLKDINKIIFFSYPAQAFGAYENGKLIYTGQTNMGRAKDPTPTGIYYTNWKAEETKSTFNDEWELKWNFNIQNDSGIGFHEYALPGYPASHSCLRLTETNAKYLYNWADQWILKGEDSVLAKGTPVIVFGSYPFGKSKPWFQLPQNANALDVSEDALQQLVAPHKEEILTEQTKRAQQPKKE